MTIEELIHFGSQQLANAKALAEQAEQNFRLEAELLLVHVWNIPRVQLYTWPERVVPTEIEQHYKQLLATRCQGEPLAYILGQQAFWSLTLQVTPAVLIPRADTEILVETALSVLADHDECKLVDLGTGSGAIALALATERPHWDITAVDKSDEALAVAKSNGKHLQLDHIKFVQSDWYQALSGQRFHVIVSNPPYVAADDPHLKDLRHEPQTALVAADDGLAAYKTIIASAYLHLYKAGWVILEHGWQQAASVQQLLKQHNFKEIRTVKDLAGLERVTLGKYSAE